MSGVEPPRLRRSAPRYALKLMSGRSGRWRARREELKISQKQPKRARLWLDDGFCGRPLPERPNHVWSFDFVDDRRHDRGAYRILNIIDECTREALIVRIDRKRNSMVVLDAPSDLFILCSAPAYVRSNNGPAFVARAVRAWVAAVGAETALLEPPVEQSIHRLDR